MGVSRGSKNSVGAGPWAPLPYDSSISDPSETRPASTGVIISSLVFIDQMVSA